MLIVGSIPFKNKADRKRKAYDLKCELGENVRIWIENRLIMYKLYKEEF
jgi:hypothetical protein